MNYDVPVKYDIMTFDDIITTLYNSNSDCSYIYGWHYDKEEDKFTYVCRTEDSSYNLFVCKPNGILNEHEFVHEQYLNVKRRIIHD